MLLGLYQIFYHLASKRLKSHTDTAVIENFPYVLTIAPTKNKYARARLNARRHAIYTEQHSQWITVSVLALRAALLSTSSQVNLSFEECCYVTTDHDGGHMARRLPRDRWRGEGGGGGRGVSEDRSRFSRWSHTGDKTTGTLLCQASGASWLALGLAGLVTEYLTG